MTATSTSHARTPFADLGLPAPLLEQLSRSGIDTPFPIQAAVIPDVLAGRDVAGRAPTGAGKTLGFGLPLVAALRDAAPRRPVALVLVPTRELAEQIMDELTPYVRAAGHTAVALYGGVGYGPQVKALARGCELVVACPGRLEDLLQSDSLTLRDVTTVVVDEADQMADMGFLPAVRRLVEATPDGRQVLLFSATLDGPVAALVEDYQRDPVRHEVGPAGPDVTAARHLFWELDRTDRIGATAEIVGRVDSTIVFTRTRHGADRLARQLGRHGVEAEAIHGGRSQRQRTRALDRFKRGECAALVATDVAARGIHVTGVSAVVHYDPPEDAATYVHRSGRTARAGATGTVVSLFDRSQRRAVRALGSEVGIVAEPTSPDPTSLTGAEPDAAGAEPVPDRAATDVAGAAAASTGVVTFFHRARGYGFIRPDLGGADLFVHHTHVVDPGPAPLEPSTRVTYSIAPGRKGPEARDVRPVPA